MVKKSEASPIRRAHRLYTFPVDRYFAEEFIYEDILREIDDAKVRVAKAAGVDATSVEVSIDMQFQVRI